MRNTMLALILGLVLVAPSAMAQCADVTVFVGDVTAGPGETIYVPVKTPDSMDGLDIEAFQFDLHYCTSKLQYTGWTVVGTLIQGMEPPLVWENPLGTINVAWAGVNDLIGPGVFIYLVFQVNPDVNCWDYCTLWATDFLLNELPLCVPAMTGLWLAGPLTDLTICTIYWTEAYGHGPNPIAGSQIQVDAPECEYSHLEVTDITGCTEFHVCSNCEYCYQVYKPDFECDDNGLMFISPLDAAWVLEYVVGTRVFEGMYQWHAADASRNGTVTAYDAALILKWLLWCFDPMSIVLPADCYVGEWDFFCNNPIPPWYDGGCCIYINQTQVWGESIGVLKGEVTGNWQGPPIDSVIPVTVEAARVPGYYNPETPIVVPFYGEAEMDVMAGVIRFTYDHTRIRLVDVDPAGLPGDLWMWAENGDGEVMVTFAGTHAVPFPEHMMDLTFMWFQGNDKASVEILDVQLNEDPLDLTLTNGAVLFPTASIITGLDQGGKGVLRFSASPNPVQPKSATTISFALGSTENIELAIYDVSGRMVRTLASGSYPGGEHTVVWNGRDDSGSALGSGVYFARMRAGDTNSQERILMLR